MRGCKIEKLCMYSKCLESTINKIWTIKINNMYLKCTILPIYGSFFTFLHVLLIFSYLNFDIGMFVLRLLVLVQLSKKIFGTINKGGVQIIFFSGGDCIYLALNSSQSQSSQYLHCDIQFQFLLEIYIDPMLS